MEETFVEIDVLIDDAAELAAEAVCACSCGMCSNSISPSLDSNG
jgi:hypothetical protein